MESMAERNNSAGVLVRRVGRNESDLPVRSALFNLSSLEGVEDSRRRMKPTEPVAAARCLSKRDAWSQKQAKLNMKRGLRGSWFALSLALYFSVSSELLGYRPSRKENARLHLVRGTACQSVGHALEPSQSDDPTLQLTPIRVFEAA